MPVVRRLMICLAWFAVSLAPAFAIELNNGNIRLELGTDSNGVPVIQRATWVGSDTSIFTDAQLPDGLTAWVPEDFTSKSMKNDVHWRVNTDAAFIRGEATRMLPGGLRVTWVVELAEKGSLIRLHVRIKNAGHESLQVEWFPGWVGRWTLPGPPETVRSWRALTFKPVEEELNRVDRVKLGSHIHSSDTSDEFEGVNPYWLVTAGDLQIYFGIEWCGGWEAKVRDDEGNLGFSVRLPPDETQLVLEPGDVIEGPVVVAMPCQGQNLLTARQKWIRERAALAQLIYPGPAPSFPLTYNHWYAKLFDVDPDFLRRQVEAMGPYQFDAFIIDAGWYERVGDWEPAEAKFRRGELEDFMDNLKLVGVKPGLWSCPQFVSAAGEELPDGIEQPPQFEPFIGGYLLDLADIGYESRLLRHVNLLRERYSVEWWKYDQPLFEQESRAGLMKNVVAFQDALRAVRLANPDLYIESCLNGGRMINELTMLTAQSMWLRDGQRTGKPHSRQNIEVALGALEFMFPWSVYRWTNNLNELDQDDAELTRLYCRSAMAGIWGMSCDVGAIGSYQQKVIVKEIQRYRQLNDIKVNCLYEVDQPEEGAETAGVTYYSENREQAGVLLYRWDGEGEFLHRVRFKELQPSATYVVRDVDTGARVVKTGKAMMQKGVSVPFSEERLSALLFVYLAE